MSELTQKSILVTGGAGLIGSALVWELNRRGRQDIVVADHLEVDEKWKNLVPLQYSDYVDADRLLAEVECDPNYLKDFGLILHLGACSATTEKDAGYLMQNNYEYTKTLAQASLDVGAKFVYASSAATYGDGSQGMDDTDPNLDRLRPLNAYGYSKHLMDLWAMREGVLDNLVALKYFNVYGPNEDHKGEMRSLVHKAYHQIVDTGKLGLFKSEHPDYKDGEQMRDFLYVKDAVNMTLHLAASDKAGGVYNIGSGEANTWIRIANSLFSAMEKEPNIEFIDLPDHLRGKYQYYTCADTQRLNETGWSGTTMTPEEAIRDYVVNYLQPSLHLGDEIVNS